MSRRVALLPLFLCGTAFALVPGPITQLTNTPVDEINPAISGDHVVWTADALANGYDIYALDLAGGGPAVDITPWAGNQYFDDVDGHYAVFIDDRNPQTVTVSIYDLVMNAATPMNVDNVSGSRPSVSNPNGGNSVAVVYVHRDANSDIVYVGDFFDVRFITQGPDQEDAPRIKGDWIVWQGQPVGDNYHHIYSYSISQQITTQLTTGAHDDINPDVDGTTVVFTRDVLSIQSVPVTGGALTQLSMQGAGGTRDRARISGATAVWDDLRNGVDYDVYYAGLGGSDRLLVGGAGDQFLTDIDGLNVVYTAGPVGGTHDIYLLKLVSCMVGGDCANGQQCDLASHTCVAKPQCQTTSDCGNGLVCVNQACVACSNDGQCLNGNVCSAGRCVPPQCVSNNGCQGGQVCINNFCGPCANNAQCNQGLVCANGACVPPQQQNNVDPDGCGINVHTLATVELMNAWHVPVLASGVYATRANHSYSVCVVNGDGHADMRTSALHFWNDVVEVLGPNDFKPNKNPPTVVVRPLVPWNLGPVSVWLAMLFGPNPPEAVKIKILESN